MQYSVCNYELKNHVGVITLNRPEVGNALNEQMILELTEIVNVAQAQEDTHVLCIRAAGKHFCTGADLYEMQHQTHDPIKLAQFMQSLHDLDVPVVASVNGAVFGGAIGLLANCDFVIAEEGAVFCLSEVKLGLVPAIISPFVIEALGVRQAKSFMLSAEKLTAKDAMTLGLVHQVVAKDLLDETVNACINHLLSNGPEALRRTKQLCREVLKINDGEARGRFTADVLSQIRKSGEAQARLKNFFEKKNV